MGEDRLDEWILETAQVWQGMRTTEEPGPEWPPPSPPPDWVALASVPDEELARWARLLLKAMHEGIDATRQNKQANPARQGFAEIEAVLVTLSSFIFVAEQLVPGGREPNGWLWPLWTTVKTGAQAAGGATRTGTAPSLGLYGASVSAKAGSPEHPALRRCAVGAVRVFQASGESERGSAVKVSKTLARAGVPHVGPDTVRSWLKQDDEWDRWVRSGDGVLIGWISDVWEKWQQEEARCLATGKPVPEFGPWALSFRGNLLTEFIPLLLTRRAEAWMTECESWGKGAP